MGAINRIRTMLRGPVNIKTDISPPLPYTVFASEMIDKCAVYERYFTDDEEYVAYSAGIGEQINFELEFLSFAKTANLYAIDPTPRSLDFMRRQSLPDRFHILPYALSDKDESLEFALPTADGWVSGTAEDIYLDADSRKLDTKNKIKVQGRSIASIMKELGHGKIDLLKMDIEGSEFKVVRSILKERLDVRQMLIDTHEHMLPHGNRLVAEMVSELHRAGYKIFYVAEEGCHSFSCIKEDAIKRP